MTASDTFVSRMVELRCEPLLQYVAEQASHLPECPLPESVLWDFAADENVVRDGDNNTAMDGDIGWRVAGYFGVDHVEYCDLLHACGLVVEGGAVAVYI